MLYDSALEKTAHSENSTEQVIWGRYDHAYDWEWNESLGAPSLTLRNRDLLARVSSIPWRDFTIASALSGYGVKKVLDVGSDTGHFMAVLKVFGIEAVGIDPNPAACGMILSKGVNHCYAMGIQDLITIPELEQDFDCLTCMNITHARWQDESLKERFVAWTGERFRYAVLSDWSGRDKWANMRLEHDFNPLPFRYTPFTQRFTQYLRIDENIHYMCIQKIFKSMGR